MEISETELSKLVLDHRFDFGAIAKALSLSERQVRERWTQIHLKRRAPKTRKPLPEPKQYIEEVTALDILELERGRKSVLSKEDVDLSKQTSISVTGEVITPSEFCILKHSLKDTFSKMEDRVREFLPDMNFDDIELQDEIVHYKVGIKGSTAVFEESHDLEAWDESRPPVEIPNFDDIKVIPDEDTQEKRPMKEVFYRGMKILVPDKTESSATEQSEEESQRTYEESVEPTTEEVKVPDNSEDCVCIVKPHESRNLFKSFLKVLSFHRLNVVQAKMMKLSPKNIMMFYEHQLHSLKSKNLRAQMGHKEFYKAMKKACFCFVVNGIDAIKVLLEAAGDIDPTEASTETLRGRYGINVEDNKFHSSFSYAQALLEAEIFEEEEDEALNVASVPDKVCFVTSVDDVHFFFDFFDFLFSLDFTLLNFCFGNISQSRREAYRKISEKVIEDESVLVVAAQRDNAYLKLKNIQRKFPTVVFSNSSDLATREIGVFFNQLFEY